MNIYNSLGSNYDLSYVTRNIFASSDQTYKNKLKKLLEEKYKGKSVLTYKGREALRLALRIINKPDDFTVGICGFTCFAVYEAIMKEGYKVEYLDIEKDSLNFSIETLELAFKKNPNLKIIFIQNTLGYPCDIERISKFCKDKDIILVEDLAHSIGSKYSNGKEVGTIGDFVMLSFSQDKVVDRVSGGALVVKNSKYFEELSKINSLKVMSPTQKMKDKFYPALSVLIRNSYSFGLGKMLHFILKKLKSLSNPMIYDDMGNIHDLPSDYAQDVHQQLQALENNLSHRKKIAAVYMDRLDKNLLFKKIGDAINLSTNLRFPIILEQRMKLIKYLKKNNIYVSDIWYDVPIAPKKYLAKTNYKKGTCPNSEYISEKILNLPTHRNVSESDAKFIADKINLWLKSQ